MTLESVPGDNRSRIYVPRSSAEMAINVNQLFDDEAYLQQLFEGRLSDTPASDRLTFDVEFDKYVARLWSAPYAASVVAWADAAVSKFTANHVSKRANLLVPIPARAVRHTSQAVEAIMEGCGRGIQPLIFVYHNYAQPPAEETQTDLKTASKRENVFLIEQALDPSVSIGDIRGFITDIAMMTAKKLAMRDPLILSADADITRYGKERTVQHIVRDYTTAMAQRRQIDGISFKTYPDLMVFAENKTLFFAQLIKEAFTINTIRVSYGNNIVSGGTSTFVRGASLAAIGSYLPVPIGEDLSIWNGLKKYRKSGHTIDHKPEYAVYRDTSKQLLANRQSEYYHLWENFRNSLSPEILSSDQLEERVLTDTLFRSWAECVDSEESRISERTQEAVLASSSQLLIDLYNDIRNAMLSRDRLTLQDMQKLTNKYLSYSHNGNDEAMTDAYTLVMRHTGQNSTRTQ